VSAIGASQRQPDAPEYSLTAYWVRQTVAATAKVFMLTRHNVILQ